MKITQNNFIIEMATDEGETMQVWICHPHDSEMSRISRVLAHFNKEMSNIGVSVAIADYERLIDESLMNYPPDFQSNLKKSLESFFSRAEASAVCSDGRKAAELGKAFFSDSERAVFRGTLLFISALWRYTMIGKGLIYAKETGEMEKDEAMKDIKRLFTSLTATDWLNSLQSAPAEQAAQETEQKVETAEMVKVSPMLS